MIRRRCCVVVLSASLILPFRVSPLAAEAAGGSAGLPLDQIVSLQTLGEARLAPDGKDVVYVVGQTSTRAGSQRSSDLWIVATDQGVPRRLLAGDGARSEPRWSPDGQSIAFVATRAGGPREVYVVKRDGTGERLIASGMAGAGGIQWSPDGRFLSFARRDPQAPKKKPNDPAVSGTDEPERLWVLDVASGAVRAITGPDLSISRDYAWSPDSAAIVVAAEPAREWVVGRQTLHIASIADGSTRVLAPLHDRTIALAWAPDGKRIAWCGREHAPDSGQLVVFDAIAPGAQTGRPLHSDFPASIQWIDFLPDGRLALAALQNMRVGLFDVSLDGGPISERASPDAFRPGSIGAGSWGRFAVSLSADGRFFATTHSGPAETGNVVVGEWAKPAKMRRLTDLNPEIGQVALGETEEISWPAPDGLQIFGLLIKPVGYQKGRRYPTIVEAHGGPRRSFWDTCQVTDSWGQMLATRGYLVLLPNPRGSEGRGPAFIRAGTDHGRADLQDVLAGVDHIVARGDADPARIGIGGWSYGGFLTAWAITQTTRFKAAVVGAGYVNQVSREGQTRGNWQAPLEAYDEPEKLLRRSPIMYVRQARTPTLILHGANDMTVPTIQSFELYTALRALQVPVEHVLYPGETHIFQDTDHMIDLKRRVVEWFDRYLKLASARVGSSRGEGP